MRTVKVGRILMGIVASMLVCSGPVGAFSQDGLVFRLNGWYRGEADISADGIKCEIPVAGEAIPDGSFSMGMWNTYGVQTLMFPDVNSPAANPCGGYVQLQNNLQVEGITVEKIQIKMRIAGWKRFRNQVPSRRGWPLACQSLRNYTSFAGTRLDPVSSVNQPTGSGQSNVAFVQILPILSTQVIQCLRSQYAGIPAEVYASLPVVISTRAQGRADNGDVFKTNTVNYTLTLRHTCGNGRIDDGEECDPASSLNSCLLGDCTDDGVCGDTNIPCATSADCIGTCIPQGGPEECICAF